jgi:hypothetical protein
MTTFAPYEKTVRGDPGDLFAFRARQQLDSPDRFSCALTSGTVSMIARRKTAVLMTATSRWVAVVGGDHTVPPIASTYPLAEQSRR